MTENDWFKDWLAAKDFDSLLDFFVLTVKPSERKLRLLAVAFCRSIWGRIADRGSRDAIEVAEAFADGGATAGTLRTINFGVEIACRFASQAARGVEAGGVEYIATKADALACDIPGLAMLVTKDKLDEVDARDAGDAAIGVAARSAIPVDLWGTGAGDCAAERASAEERSRQIQLLHDFLGNPLRPATSLSPAVLAWNDATICRLASGVYEERAFGRLPILADALLDASCDDEDLIQHCRSAGPHVRGCWALDAILGRS